MSDPRLVGIEELEEGEGGEALMGSIYVVGSETRRDHFD